MISRVRFVLGLVLAATAVLVSQVRAGAENAGFVWAYALHDSYSNDTFYSVDFTKPFGPSAPIRPYAELLLQRDSQTTTGVLPQTFNDNYGLAAAGMQLQTNSGMRVFAQIGTSFDFGPAIQGLPVSSHADARGGVEYDRDWNVPPAGLNRYYGTFFGDFIYYSRYQNALMYFEAERGHEFGSRTYPVQLYFRLSGSQDTKREYYNDAIALAGGLDFLALGRHGPSVGFTESFNAYTSPVPAGVLRSYWSFRPQITYGASF
jgi:hypothetical protein